MGSTLAPTGDSHTNGVVREAGPRRNEIADALSRIRVDDRHATMIRQSEDPPAALGRVLKDASSWGTSGTGVVAAELLHVRSSKDELRQILAVAGAYGADS